MLNQVHLVLAAHPQVYHACHVEHARARTNAAHVSASDAWILGHLHPTEPVSPAALAAHLSLRSSTVAEAVLRLESLGYLSRVRPPHDKRQLELFLTPQGAAAMARASIFDGRRVRKMLALVPATKRAQAVQGLTLLAQAARSLNALEPKRWRGRDNQ